MVYVGGSNDTLCAVKVATGKEVWVQSVSKVSAAPTMAGGLVFATAMNGEFDVFHATTSVPVWSVPIAGSVLFPFEADFATDGKRVAIAPGDQSLYMYDAAAGAKLWSETTSVDSGFGQTVAMNGNVVYALGQLGTLVALDAANGNQIGQFATLGNDSVGTAMVISDGTLYFGSDPGTLYAVDTTRGHVRVDIRRGKAELYFLFEFGCCRRHGVLHRQQWPPPRPQRGGRQADMGVPPGNQDVTGPVATGGKVYVLVGNGDSLQQLDAKTGKLGWSFSAVNQARGSQPRQRWRMASFFLSAELTTPPLTQSRRDLGATLITGRR